MHEPLDLSKDYMFPSMSTVSDITPDISGHKIVIDDGSHAKFTTEEEQARANVEDG